MIGKGIELNKAGTDTPLMMETRFVAVCTLWSISLHMIQAKGFGVNKKGCLVYSQAHKICWVHNVKN